jgi:hypothetical protein
VSVDLGIRCLACGVLSVREARFCRQCGAVLRDDDLRGAIAGASPDALTVEFTDKRRNTSPLTVAATCEELAQEKRQTSALNALPVPEPVPVKPVAVRRRSRMAVACLSVAVLGGAAIWTFRDHRVLNLGAHDVTNVPHDAAMISAVPATKAETPPSAIVAHTPDTKSPNAVKRAPTTAEPQPVKDLPEIAENNPKESKPNLPLRPKQKTAAATPNLISAHVNDDMYQRGANIVTGRDVRKLNRAELLQAMQYFQNVKPGPKKGLAQRQVELLGHEIDRRTWK